MITTAKRVLSVPAATRANDPFGRYSPMDKHEVRALKVEGTELDKLRQRREMLRSMDPERVKQVIEFHRDLTVFEALASAKREGRLIVPRDVHDRILTETKDKEYFRENYPTWAGTFIICEAPSEKFRDTVIFSFVSHAKLNYSMSFKVPKKFQGKRNCAIIGDYSDFELIDRELVASSRDLSKGQTDLGSNRYELKVVDERSVHRVKSFPEQTGWYLTNNGIPFGTEVDSSIKGSTHLWRSVGTYIGLLASGFYNQAPSIGADSKPVVSFGAALF